MEKVVGRTGALVAAGELVVIICVALGGEGVE